MKAPASALLPLLIMFCTGSTAASPSLPFHVISSTPTDPRCFTQGLQHWQGLLYQSCGGYGESRLEVHTADRAASRRTTLPDNIFAEGFSRLGDKLYLLSWREHQLRVYDPALKLLEIKSYPREGWGLTQNGSQLIASDGTDQLYVIDPATLQVERVIHVTDQGRPVQRLNELEWVEGLIYANVWQTDLVLRIDPTNGHVIDHLNLAGLLPEHERRPDTDVLNGIAWDAARQELLVTGKRWPKRYALKLAPAPAR